jgi:hypothetical protein
MIGTVLPGLPPAQAETGIPSVSHGRSFAVLFTTSDRHAYADELPFHNVGAGRYVAAYFPQFGGGFVNVRDDFPGGSLWVRAPFGHVLPFEQRLEPHHRYLIYVVMEHPGRFLFPDANYHVVWVHSRVIPVTFASRALPISGASPQLTRGTMPNLLDSSESSMTSVVVHYQHPSSRVIGGGACVAPAPVSPCDISATRSTFFGSRYGFGGDGGDEDAVFSQDIAGTAYSTAQKAAYIDGDFEVVQGAPFTSARLIAFGVRPDQ